MAKSASTRKTARKQYTPHSLKVECIQGERFAEREIIRTRVFNYIECDYNRWLRHSTCGGLSPEQFERANLA